MLLLMLKSTKWQAVLAAAGMQLLLLVMDWVVFAVVTAPWTRGVADNATHASVAGLSWMIFSLIRFGTPNWPAALMVGLTYLCPRAQFPSLEEGARQAKQVKGRGTRGNFCLKFYARACFGGLFWGPK